MAMKRVSVSLDDPLHHELVGRARTVGAPVSEFARKLLTLRFNFPFAEAGKRATSDSAEVLEATFRAAISELARTSRQLEWPARFALGSGDREQARGHRTEQERSNTARAVPTHDNDVGAQFFSLLLLFCFFCVLTAANATT